MAAKKSVLDGAKLSQPLRLTVIARTNNAVRRDRTSEDNCDSLDSALTLAISSWREIVENGESRSASLARSHYTQFTDLEREVEYGRGERE